MTKPQRTKLPTLHEIDTTMRALGYHTTTILILKNAVSRDRRCGTNEPDGYPTNTSASPTCGGGLTITVPDEHGQPDTIPVTPTELAVLTRARRQEDPLHDTIIAAWTHIRRQYDEHQRAQAQLQRLATYDEDLEQANSQRCALCPNRPPESSLVNLTINGKTQLVCRWAYEQTTQRRKGFNINRLPNTDEIRRHHDGQKVHVTK